MLAKFFKVTAEISNIKAFNLRSQLSIEAQTRSISVLAAAYEVLY